MRCACRSDALLSRHVPRKRALVSVAESASAHLPVRARPTRARRKAPPVANAEFDQNGACLKATSVAGRQSLVVRDASFVLRPANDRRPATDDGRLPSNKKPARPATLMVPETGIEYQSRRSTYRLRKCTRQKNRSILSPCASRTHQEHYILPALQRRLDLDKVLRIVHGLLVHFQDHVAAI